MLALGISSRLCLARLTNAPPYSSFFSHCKKWLHVLSSSKSDITSEKCSSIVFSGVGMSNNRSPVSESSITRSVPATKVEYLQKLLFQQPTTPQNGKLLKVAVLGCPNSGKSSLVNMLIKWRVCAVAAKAHTTRSKQLATFVQDDVQLAFLDLPGLVTRSKTRKFNLEKSFIRDPHAAIYESDLVLVVVDVSHKHSKLELDPEIIKALHFFKDKESVLVLNKTDKLRNNPTKLLEITRKLTGGIVNGRSSHVDAYQSRFIRRAKNSPNAKHLLPPDRVIAELLPPVCHAMANQLLESLAHLRLQLNASSSQSLITSRLDPVLISAESTAEINQEMKIHNSGSDNNSTQSCMKNSTTDTASEISQEPSNTSAGAFLQNRVITEVDKENIDVFFRNYKPESTIREQNDSTVETSIESSTCLPTHANDLIPKPESDLYLDSVVSILEQQLLLKTVTAEEVAKRRAHWLEITKSVKGITKWTGFKEVFMVSSATGDGVDKLRSYLISKAIPNRLWLLCSSLITDQEPMELVRMCVWSHCLNKLTQEVPYSLRIVVDDCEKLKLDDGDDRIYVHARIQCRNERHLKHVLGPRGETIKEMAAAVKLELMSMFNSDTVVKLTAELSKIEPSARDQLKRANDFTDVFPEFGSPA